MNILTVQLQHYEEIERGRERKKYMPKEIVQNKTYKIPGEFPFHTDLTETAVYINISEKKKLGSYLCVMQKKKGYKEV